MSDLIYLVANGDLRLSANRQCWDAQHKVEQAIMEAIRREGRQIERAHPYDEQRGHGFIDSQKHGNQVFRGIPPEAPLVVCEAVWQYSHHVLPGLVGHRGPDPDRCQLERPVAGPGGDAESQWLSHQGRRCIFHAVERGLLRRAFPHADCASGWPASRCAHDTRHVHALEAFRCRRGGGRSARNWPAELRRDKAIMGVFDEGCMGMYNAIIPDENLMPLGVFKERLSQSALYAAMREVRDDEARAVRAMARRQGHAIPHRPASRDRPDRRADPGPVQDVHRRAAHRRRFRLRRHRHSVPAGIERSGAGIRPGGGPAEQRRPPAGEGARATAACSTKASRCRISTKWTNARASTRW